MIGLFINSTILLVSDILDVGELILPKNEKFEKESTETSPHIFPEVVEIRKASSTSNNLHIDNKGSHDSVYSVPDQSRALPNEGRQTQSKMKIIMGKRALLRSRSRDFQKDAVVVHELVNVMHAFLNLFLCNIILH